MPHTVNGIGTWYYGKSNVHTEVGLCPHCNHVSELKSYDTNLYFVVIYIPLIPLGRKRVLCECSHCRKHQVMKLDEWNKTRTEAIQAQSKLAREKPGDEETLIKLLETLVSFQAKAPLLQLVSTLETQSAASWSDKLYNHLGDSCEVFHMFHEAEKAYRKSLELNSSEETRRSLARVLIKQKKSEEAGPLLKSILTKPLKDQLGMLYFLVYGLQAEGKHKQALSVLHDIEKTFPECSNEKEYKSLVKTSSKHLSDGKRIVSPILRNPSTGKESSSSYVRWIGPAVVFGILLLYFGIALYKGLYVPIQLINGTRYDYSITLNGNPIRLQASSRQLIHIRDGAAQIESGDDILAIKPFNVSIHTSFFSRPFVAQKYVINPDQSAILIQEQAEYSEHPDPNAPPLPYQIYFGKTFYDFHDVDYFFKKFPDEVSLKSHEAKVIKSGLSHIPVNSILNGYTLLSKQLGPTDANKYIDILREATPLDPNIPFLLLATRSKLETLALIKPNLDKEPLLLQWHRAYQQLQDAPETLPGLISEYRQRLAQAPQDNQLKYLLGRIVTDHNEAVDLFTQAIRGSMPSAYAHMALSYDYQACGKFESALTLIEKALDLEKHDPQFESLHWRTCRSLNKTETLLQYVERYRKENPNDGELVATHVRLLIERGTLNSAREIAMNYIDSLVQMHEKPEVIKQWSDYLKAVELHEQGDLAGYATNISSIATPSFQFQSATIRKNFSEAAHYLDQLAETGNVTNWRILLAGLALLEGKTEISEAQLKIAAQQLSSGGYEERCLSQYLIHPESVDENLMLSMPLDPSMKGFTLLVLAARTPVHNQAYLELAEKLNYGHTFPHLTLKDAYAALARRNEQGSVE